VRLVLDMTPCGDHATIVYLVQSHQR
jgi:hypothetical protein